MNSIVEIAFGIAMFSMGFYAASVLAFSVADELNISRAAVRAALKRTLRRW